MSIGVLFLSIIFAAIETGMSWLMLSFQPVASIFAGVPLWLITASVFSLGMVLSYILILIIGGARITSSAADFVRDHFGRTLALMLVSVLLIFGLASGAETLYQLGPIQIQHRSGAAADICFVLDYSSSMSGDRVESLRKAFAQAVNSMDDGQRLCVVRYDNEARVIFDWAALNASTRSEAIRIINEEEEGGGTDYDSAFTQADQMVREAVASRRMAAVVMISDGEGYFSDLNTVAPSIMDSRVPVYTIGFGTGAFDKLREIADLTGGEFLMAGDDVGQIETTLTQATQTASSANTFTLTPDTLLTARLFGRTAIINATVLRILLLAIVSFIFKLIVNVCVGNNDSNIAVHVVMALVIAIVGALAVEFGYMFGLPMIAVEAFYWLLMMVQIVRTDR